MSKCDRVRGSDKREGVHVRRRRRYAAPLAAPIAPRIGSRTRPVLSSLVMHRSLCRETYERCRCCAQRERRLCCYFCVFM